VIERVASPGEVVELGVLTFIREWTTAAGRLRKVVVRGSLELAVFGAGCDEGVPYMQRSR
jgi:hypothetical protein